jgi:hypothetical protein
MEMNFHKNLVILLFIGLSVPLSGQSAYQLCDASNEVFIPGEKLEYALYYNWNFIWIPAGLLTFYIAESQGKYLVRVTGKTHESYNWFFRVNDEYECLMDKSSLRPAYFKRDIEEGDYKIWNEITFDYEKDSLTSTVRINDNPPESYHYSIEPCVLDLLSLTYKLRNIDIDSLAKMKQMNMHLIFDEKIYNIPLRYLGIERSKHIRGLGRMSLHRISPDLIEGNVFREGQKMILWVSMDGNRIPVLIESPIKVGSIKAILKDYENLKFPFNPALN